MMSCFKLPKALCDDIKSLVRNFWWGQKGNEKKMCWMKWERLCKMKTGGGLGFRDLEAINIALLAKQGWRIVKNPDYLAAKVIKPKYYVRRDFWNGNLGSDTSYLWMVLLVGESILPTVVVWLV